MDHPGEVKLRIAIVNADELEHGIRRSTVALLIWFVSAFAGGTVMGFLLGRIAP
jgi:hypothetical protein